MNAPFAGSIVGSWKFIRSTHPDFDPKNALIYHFTADGKNYWEIADKYNQGQRHFVGLRYRFSNDVLTLVYQDDKERDHILSYAEDGSVEIPNSPPSHIWWMVRLEAPEADSIAFVDLEGKLQRL